MISNRKILIIVSMIFILLHLSMVPPAYGKVVWITEYSYDTHYEPGETVNFSTRVYNSTAAELEDMYINIVLTNLSTGAVVLPYPASSATDIPAGATVTITTDSTSWTATEGTYTVTIILYDRTSREQHRVSGSEPMRVGRAEDFVSAFPNIIDFGALPYGRYMLPNPIRIHWNFYMKNRLRRDHPWYMRIYTDNRSRYKGIKGALYQNRRTYFTSKIWVRTNVENTPSGLISSDGKYAIPLRVWCLNFGPDWEEVGWNDTLLGPPPVNDDYVWKGPLLDDGKRDNDRRAWLWIPDISDMTSDKRTWRSLIGRDPYNANFVGDNNPTGDFTLDSPFDIYLATEASPTTVMGKYSGKLVIEIYTP